MSQIHEEFVFLIINMISILEIEYLEQEEKLTLIKTYGFEKN